MKKMLISFILIFTSFFLVACGGGSSTETQDPPPVAAGFEPGTHPRFDPVVSDLPFNTDLIFARAATTDGTADVGAASDPVRAGLNQLDGFSTSSYFDVLISGSIDPSTVTTATVFLLQLNTGTNDALNPANVTGIVGPATYTVGVVSLDGGTNNTIRIRPTLPLKSKAKYLVFVTNDVRDAAGNALTASWSYNSLRDPSYSTLASLLPVRNAILGWETLAGGFLAAISNGALTSTTAKQKIVISYTFTTTDPQTPLVAMASPRAAIAGLQIAAGVSAPTAVATVNALNNANLLPSPKARNVGLVGATGIDIGVFSNLLQTNISTLYTGYIELPYYLTAPGALPFGDFVKYPWMPDTGLATQLGITLPTDLDGSYNMTYRFPFAKSQSVETVPLQVTMPNDATVPGLAEPATCAQIFGTTGYPVVIYVHGITSDRSSIISLGHTLSSRCIATVSIDLPLHGIPANSPFVNALNVERNGVAAVYNNGLHERHFNVAGPGGAPAPMNFTSPTEYDGSGAQFVNLRYFNNNRDNLRQGVIDLLNLNASLANVNTALEQFLAVGIDTSKVYVVGMSLGGIVSANFVTSNQLALGAEAQLGLTSVLNPIRGTVMSASGTQVSQIMINSPTFGSAINAGLAAAGVNQGTSNYERFVYTIQSMLDSGDPVSFAQTLGNLPDALKMPILLQEIKNDLVIPNNNANAPLMGTDAFASLMGLTQLAPGTTQLGKGLVRMNVGEHTSLLRPADAAPQVTPELQAQVVSFVLGAGNVSVGAYAASDVELPAM